MVGYGGVCNNAPKKNKTPITKDFFPHRRDISKYHHSCLDLSGRIDYFVASLLLNARARSLVDKASASGAEDRRFKSCRAYHFFFREIDFGASSQRDISNTPFKRTFQRCNQAFQRCNQIRRGPCHHNLTNTPKKLPKNSQNHPKKSQSCFRSPRGLFCSRFWRFKDFPCFFLSCPTGPP